ncbi:MAG: serine/threonine-protein kinase [Candidatus Hadarchaeum sp.]
MSTVPISAEEARSIVPEGVRTALADEFEVIRLLGAGGMGVVYLAHERTLDRLVAVKVLKPELSANERYVQRFLLEARLAAKLRHPNIVSIHAVGDRQGLRYYTMDYVEGCTLDVYCRSTAQGFLSAEKARGILCDIARAMGYAHRQGIIHRDLKPSNVMVDKVEHVYVMDFGLAKPQGGAHLTTAGVIMGTPYYMSPEQLEGKPATPRSDIYALGLIYFYMLTGEYLVKGDSITAVIAQHLSGAPVTQVASDPRLPANARQLLLAMIERDPRNRPATADEIIAALGAPTIPIPTTRKSDPLLSPAAPRILLSQASAVSRHDVRKQARERIRTLLDKRDKGTA